MKASERRELCLFHTHVQQEERFDSAHVWPLAVWKGICGATHMEIHPQGKYTFWKELKGEADVSLIIAGGLRTSLQICLANLFLHSDSCWL